MKSVNLLELTPERLVAETGRSGGKAGFAFSRFRSAPGRWFGRLLGRSPTVRLTLDEKSTAVWDLIDGARSVEMIAEALRRRLGGEPAVVRDQVAALLRTLERKGLVRLRGGELDRIKG